ncbi:MAG: ribonuclease E/G [Clostridium sp.]|nr:ribonuclease E/G [Clostridium sp.]MCM1209730.1 ribonuclease E/G [Ruminococcus sp.]
MDARFVITSYNDIMLGCLISEGKLEDIRCYEETSLIGNIYVGKVSNILNNINAAFVDIKKGVSCYLSLEDYHGDKPLKVGDELVVQVTKDSIKTKQPTVTTNISMTGEYVVVHCDKTIGVSAKIKGEAVRNALKDVAGRALEAFQEHRLCQDISYGVILRTKCRDILSDKDVVSDKDIKSGCDSLNVIYDDVMSTAEKLDTLLKNAGYLKCYSVVKAGEPPYIKDLAGMSDDISIITDDNSVYGELCEFYGKDCGRISFYADDSISLNSIYNIPVTIEKCLKKNAYLKSGGYLVIEPTEAMTVIDVNSGKAIKGKNREEDLFKINVEAAYEIARQIRLRNLSGIIIIDFISMKSTKNQILLVDELKKATISDYVGVTVVDITRLGLVELTRKKIRKPLHEVF